MNNPFTSSLEIPLIFKLPNVSLFGLWRREPWTWESNLRPSSCEETPAASRCSDSNQTCRTYKPHGERHTIVGPPCASEEFSSKECTFSNHTIKNAGWVLDKQKCTLTDTLHAASAFISHRKKKAAWSLGLTGWMVGKKRINLRPRSPPTTLWYISISPGQCAVLSSFYASCTRATKSPFYCCPRVPLERFKQSKRNQINVHYYAYLEIFFAFICFSQHTPQLHFKQDI